MIYIDPKSFFIQLNMIQFTQKQELSLDQNIYTVAQDGQYLYLGTTSQLNRVDIAQKDQGTQVSQLICDDGADDGFQIYDGFISVEKTPTSFRW